MGWMLTVLGFDYRSRPVLGPIQPPIQWVPGTLSLGVKRPGSEADYSFPPSAEVKNEWTNTSTSPIRLHGVVLRDNFTLPFNLTLVNEQ